MTTPPARDVPARGRRAAWLFVDQGFSSLTNFLVAVAVARVATSAEFGAFSIAVTIYYFLLELVRPLALEPLLIRYSGKDGASTRAAASGAASTALAVGVFSGAVLLAAGAVGPDSVRPVLTALAVVLPGLLVQDACRYALLAAGDARFAALTNVVWTVVSLCVFVVLSATAAADAGSLLLGWGLAGTLCAAVGLVRTRSRLAPGRVSAWLREHRELSPRFVVEYLIDAGAFQLTILLVGLIGGLSALGALNGARLLLGPVGVVFLAMAGLAVSEGSRLRDARDRRLVPAIRIVGVALTLLTLAWTAMLLLLPTDVGVALLGETFAEAEALLPLLGLYWAARGAIVSAKWGLRIFAAARNSLRAMSLVAPMTLIGGAVGAVLGDATGAAIGLAAASAAGAGVWWWQLGLATRHFTADRHGSGLGVAGTER
jgi:O-antigen/teichoic acid export membrane protein